MATPRRFPCLLAAALAASLLLPACVTPPAPPPPAPASIPKDQADGFQAIDPASAAAVSCSVRDEYALADGRWEVLADLEDRLDHPISVRVQCLFADQAGAPGAEAGAWQGIAVTPGVAETVRFDAGQPGLKVYLIRAQLAPQPAK